VKPTRVPVLGGAKEETGSRSGSSGTARCGGASWCGSAAAPPAVEALLGELRARTAA
jgi:hypothetical protein